jgi:hypothetical protein
MFLAIISYQYLFGQLLKIADPTNKVELVEQKTVQHERSILKSNDTLVSHTTIHQFENGMQLTENTKDTLYSSGKHSIQSSTPIITKKLGDTDYWKMVGIVFIMIIYVTMVYGPIAAFLVELFPTKIRYTSMSLPYHIGNGVFGGLTPFIATLLTTIYTNDKLAGLMYPIIVAAICLVIGALYIQNKIDPPIEV